jgi:hypothetical protein
MHVTAAQPPSFIKAPLQERRPEKGPLADLAGAGSLGWITKSLWRGAYNASATAPLPLPVAAARLHAKPRERVPQAI